MALQDLTAHMKNRKTGAEGMTAKQTLRSAITKQMEGFSYEEPSFHSLGCPAYLLAPCPLFRPILLDFMTFLCLIISSSFPEIILSRPSIDSLSLLPRKPVTSAVGAPTTLAGGNKGLASEPPRVACRIETKQQMQSRED